MDNIEHVCNGRAICFQCFRAGMERARTRREAWAQRSLPFEVEPRRLTPRAIAHRQQMLDYLAKLAARSTGTAD